MKYRKKPVVIDAVEYKELGQKVKGVCTETHGSRPGGPPHIHTLEGLMTVSEGDFIITGVKGERYPCKPDIFAATYEAV